MTNTSVTHCSVHAKGDEFIFRGLYLYHTYWGPSPNQKAIIRHGYNGMGTTVAHNWEVREGFCPNAKIVVHAQGLHVNAGDWHNSFSLVFEDERFKGSTLQVMGIPVEGGEWAIVGGTGHFAMATGVIHKRVHEKKSEGSIIELTIHGFYPLLKGSRRIPYLGDNYLQILPIKLGTWGGNGGAAQDITEPPKRLESITIGSEGVVDSIAFSYLDQNGQKHIAGPWGGPGGNPNTIVITMSEFVTFGVFEGFTIITSLKVTTNLKMHGPFGREEGTPFRVPVQGGSGVTGFFACSGQYLDAIGVYVHPNQVNLNDKVSVSSSCFGST